MDAIKVSVIMPVYNSEKTIERSIESVQRQSLEGIEIIIVDDGSLDNLVNKVDEIKLKNKNIVLLRQDHQGAGPARNYGIRCAQGEFIAFLDSDDEFVDSDSLEKMVTACEKNHAEICGSYRLVVEDGIEKEVDLYGRKHIAENGIFVEFKDFQHDYDYQSFIFRKSFLIKEDICFPSYFRYRAS